MESMLTNILVGLLTGIFTSVLVSRHYYRRGHLDTVSVRLKACCPYRRESVRHGDGLGDTAHAFLVLSEVMNHAGFSRESAVVNSIALEMDALATLPSPESEAMKQERDALKRKWAERLSKL